MTKSRTAVHETRGNIFADLGFPGAEAHLLKAEIVSELYRLTTERMLTQAKSGELMGITQPEISRLFKGHFREYSVERLMEFLTCFDLDVEIVSQPKSRKGQRGQIRFKSLATAR